MEAFFLVVKLLVHGSVLHNELWILRPYCIIPLPEQETNRFRGKKASTEKDEDFTNICFCWFGLKWKIFVLKLTHIIKINSMNSVSKSQKFRSRHLLLSTKLLYRKKVQITEYSLKKKEEKIPIGSLEKEKKRIWTYADDEEESVEAIGGCSPFYYRSSSQELYLNLLVGRPGAWFGMKFPLCPPSPPPHRRTGSLPVFPARTFTCSKPKVAKRCRLYLRFQGISMIIWITANYYIWYTNVI